jgi:hypothetical protein
MLVGEVGYLINNSTVFYYKIIVVFLVGLLAERVRDIKVKIQETGEKIFFVYRYRRFIKVTYRYCHIKYQQLFIL